ncbi:MAG: hypothetical protein EP312_07355 [Gammaproteobacteria bacterium]|nr:MAG: hypothetical protein EP312_07355 [Gammaproteobacteria bacterium]
MPNRDDTEIMDFSGMRAERPAGATGTRPAVKTPTGKQPKAPKPAAAGSHDGFATKFLLVIALLLAFGAGVWAFLLQQSMGQAQQDLMQAQARIADLERRLSSSDDSWNQSSAAMAVKIKELVEKTDTLWQEMDKLWASAWRRNQKDIGDQAALLKKQDALLKSQAKTLEGLRKELSGGISNTGKRIEQLEQSTAARQKVLDDAVARFNKLAGEQAALNKRMTTNEEWIESINTHRKQINQSLDSLRKSIDNLNRPASGQSLQ